MVCGCVCCGCLVFVTLVVVSLNLGFGLVVGLCNVFLMGIARCLECGLAAQD